METKKTRSESGKEENKRAEKKRFSRRGLVAAIGDEAPWLVAALYFAPLVLSQGEESCKRHFSLLRGRALFSLHRRSVWREDSRGGGCLARREGRGHGALIFFASSSSSSSSSSSLPSRLKKRERERKNKFQPLSTSIVCRDPLLHFQPIPSALRLFRRTTSRSRRRRREGDARMRARGARGARGARARIVFWLFFRQVRLSHPRSTPPPHFLERYSPPSARSHRNPHTQNGRRDTRLPGIDALQRSALTSALPRAESKDAREDRVPPPGGEEIGDEEIELAPPAPPPNTLVFDSTLSSERRPSTRPSDVAGEGRAFSVVVASVFGRGLGGSKRVRKKKCR